LDIHQIKELLEKYRQGNCTEEESVFIEDWLDDIKNDEQKYFSDSFIDHQLSVAKKKIDENVMVQSVFRPKNNRGWMAMAASVLILAGASVAIWVYHPKKPSTGQLAKQSGIEQYIRKGWVYVETQKGVTGHIQLPDGSLITVDASSKLRYPVKFVNNKRPVYLDEGEALFEVAKDKSKPFTVYTAKFATTALGTAFNIRSYAKEHRVSISLIHGKIRVDNLQSAAKSRDFKILLPHQQIVLNKISGRLTKINFKEEAPITSWKDGVLSFKDAAMDEVLNSIENKFNVEIKNQSNRTNWSYTGTFKDEPLNDILKTVCLTEGITFNVNKNSITLN
jgi:transmembrane sensor